MPEIKCDKCSFRSKYDNRPSSFLGRLWRWHINWCPGWKSYMKSLGPDEREEIISKYNIKK
jgi:hypothetical protein